MDLRGSRGLLLGLDELTNVWLQALHKGVHLNHLWQFWQQHNNVVECRDIVLDGAMLFKLMEFITHNIGVV